MRQRLCALLRKLFRASEFAAGAETDDPRLLAIGIQLAQAVVAKTPELLALFGPTRKCQLLASHNVGAAPVGAAIA